MARKESSSFVVERPDKTAPLPQAQHQVTRSSSSDRDVTFSIGRVEMVIPAGTEQDAALDDAALFANTARGIADLTACESDGRVEATHVFSISYLLQLCEAMIESAQHARAEVHS